MTASARFIVLWSTPEDPPEFDRHYREVHIQPGVPSTVQNSPHMAQCSAATAQPRWRAGWEDCRTWSFWLIAAVNNHVLVLLGFSRPHALEMAARTAHR